MVDKIIRERRSISLEKKFKIVKSDTSIFILYKEVPNKILQAYKIDGFNYLLFSDDFEFYGVLLKNISDKELKEIQNSKCL